MKSFSLQDGVNLPDMIGRLSGAAIQALALVCTVGESPYASVLAFITPGAAGHEPFRHAIEMEGDYSEALSSFDADEPPYYGAKAMPIDLDRTASEIGVDRVLCLVTLDATGAVKVARDYEGVEVTLLEATKIQFTRFMEILDCESPNRPLQLH